MRYELQVYNDNNEQFYTACSGDIDDLNTDIRQIKGFKEYKKSEKNLINNLKF